MGEHDWWEESMEPDWSGRTVPRRTMDRAPCGRGPNPSRGRWEKARGTAGVGPVLLLVPAAPFPQAGERQALTREDKDRVICTICPCPGRPQSSDTSKLRPHFSELPPVGHPQQQAMLKGALSGGFPRRP